MTSQRGNFALGLIVGLLIGLALALGVALYVTKVPVPFVNKVPQRTAEQDAAEAERNKNWDPNAPLAGKPAPPRPAASGTAPPPGVAVVPPAPARPAASAPAGGGSRKARSPGAAPQAARSSAKGARSLVRISGGVNGRSERVSASSHKR